MGDFLNKATDTFGAGAASGAIGSLFGMAGSAVNYALQKKLAKQQQAYNVQNAATAQQYALEQQQNASDLQFGVWSKQFAAENQRQNELLLNQKGMEVQAMRNAGLNPALAGGQPSTVGVSNPSSAAPSGSGPMASAGLAHADTEGLGQVFANTANVGLAASLLREQKNTLKSQQKLNYAEANFKSGIRDPTIRQLNSLSAHADAQAQLAQANMQRVQQLTPLEAKEIEAKANLSDAQRNYVNQKLNPEIRMLAAQATYFDQLTNESKAHEELYREEKNTQRSLQGYYGASSRNQAAQAGYYFVMGSQVQKNIELIGEMIGKTQEEKVKIRMEGIESFTRGELNNWLMQYRGSVTPYQQWIIDQTINAASAFSGVLKASAPLLMK